MNQMEPFIVPIKTWDFGIENGKSYKKNIETSGFKASIENVIDSVRTSQREVEEKQYLLATGNLENLHELPIAEAKAALSVDMMISLRNKALDSYNELMRMNI